MQISLLVQTARRSLVDFIFWLFICLLPSQIFYQFSTATDIPNFSPDNLVVMSIK